MVTSRSHLLSGLHLVALSLLGAFVAGCYTTTYYTKAPRGQIAYDEWNHRWLYALIESGARPNVDELCPGGLAEVTTKTTVLNALAGGLVNTALSLAVAIPAYNASRRADDTYITWESRSPNNLYQSSLQIWSPSTIEVQCAGQGTARSTW